MSSNKKTSILLIDENIEDIKKLKTILWDSSVRYDLIEANGVYAAFDIIQQQKVDIILLELNLKESSGFKTLTIFKEQVQNLPFIIITKVNNEIIGNQSVKAGAQDFLVKWQFDGKTLGRAIRYAIQRYKTTQRLEEIAKNLSISEKRFLDAQAMAQFGNFEMDIVNNSMSWTKEIFNIFGLRPFSVDTTLSTYINYVHVDDKEQVVDFFEEITESAQLKKIEHRIVQEDHTIKHVALTAKVFFDEITEKILLIGGVQDVTERKISEQLIIEKNMSSKASKVKEEALMSMSFHIRTPLASIVNLLFLLENSRLNPPQKEFLGDLKTSVDDLSIMVNNLLNFSMLSADQIKLEEGEIKLKDLFQSLKRLIQIKADKTNQSIEFNIPKKINAIAYSDSQKITQLVYNLTDNALKNSSGTTPLIFQAKLLKEDPTQTYLLFKIIDDTTTLSEEEVEKIEDAEKLLQIYSEEITDTDQHELLNMAMVSKLTHILSGEMTIDNQAEKGVSYQVRLPVRLAKTTPLISNMRPDAPLKILLVEDHFLNQIATKKVLTTWSEYVKVDIAENGLIAVEKQKEMSYDIVLMDIQMPVMNGIDAAKKIRQSSDIPIVALTANASKQEADRCLTVGMNDYLGKPFKPQELYAKIMNILVLQEA